MEVGEVIQFYDSDRRFPAWGFGGRTVDGSISHCFNLNGSANGFEVRRCLSFLAFCNDIVSLKLLNWLAYPVILKPDQVCWFN